MLGRLEMDVDECITAYTELMKPVFEARLRRLPLDWRLQTRAQFDSAKLESAVKKVIKGRGISETELFNDKVARGCKV